MTQLEMLKAFMPDITDETLLKAALERAKLVILNRRYPFGYPAWTEVEPQYEDVQLSIAIELVSRMGAEGETAHSENGVSRSFENAGVSESLLRQVVPMAKCSFMGGDADAGLDS